MSTEQGINEAIDKLFQAETKDHPEELVRYVERLHESYREALRSMNRRTFMLLVTWVVAVALGSGQVTEAEIGGIKIAGIISLLPAFPFVIGFIGYDLICAGSAAGLLWKALVRCYKNALPTAWEFDLEFFIAPPTYSNVERLFDKHSRINDIMSYLIIFLFGAIVLLGPLLAVAHITYLGWNINKCSKVLLCVSTGFAFILWVRSIVLFSVDWKCKIKELNEP